MLDFEVITDSLTSRTQLLIEPQDLFNLKVFFICLQDLPLASS